MATIETETLSHNALASIATHVESCLRAFNKLCSGLQSSDRANLYQIRLSDVQDELGRFRIWSGNIGAHRTGRSSLSYRLRDASHLKVRVTGLLTDLEDALQDASEIIHGEKVPWEELSDSDSDSTISENYPALEEAANGPLQATSELQQLMSEVVEVITCLLRLSMAIRNPAPHDQFMESSQINTSYFESFDIGHVQAKFPGAEGYLINRLGRAISRRRQYLKYRDEHHKKLAQGIEDIIGTEFASTEVAPTEINPESTVASSIPLAMKAPTTHIDLDEDVYSEDGLSQTSYATSANGSTNNKPPPIPKEAQEGKPFECPLCFMIISIRNSHSWKKHVYRDLRPYICTFEDCKTSDRLFEARYQWFDHEMQTHRRWWQCVGGCDKPFYSKSSFEAHLQQAHPDLSGRTHLPALVRICERKASVDTPADCSLCHQPFLSLTQLRRHMGQHHEQLALFAIPPNLGETEDDSKTRSNKEAEKESIGSGRTESEAGDDETASNKEAPHDGRTKESEELAEDAIDTGEDEAVQVIEEHSDTERPRRIIVEERRRSNIMGTDEESSSGEDGGLELLSRTIVEEKRHINALRTDEDSSGEESDSERPQGITVEERRRSGYVEINSDDIVEAIEEHSDIEPPRKGIARGERAHHDTMTVAPRRKSAVGFLPESVTGVSRPVNASESWAVYNFESHARKCAYCHNPYEVHRNHDQLCEVGHRLAQDVARYIYNADGETYSVNGKGHKLERVEIPAGYDEVRGLLKAVEQSLRHRSRKRRPFLSMDRTYYIAPPTLPERSRSVKIEQPSKPIRPRSGEIVDWPQKTEVTTEVSSSASKRGSLYEMDLAQQRRDSVRYRVEAREPSQRDIREFRDSKTSASAATARPSRRILAQTYSQGTGKVQNPLRTAPFAAEGDQNAPGTLISSSKEENNVEDEEAAAKGRFSPKDKDSSMNDSASTAVEPIRVQLNLTPVTSAQPTTE